MRGSGSTDWLPKVEGAGVAIWDFLLETLYLWLRGTDGHMRGCVCMGCVIVLLCMCLKLGTRHCLHVCFCASVYVCTLHYTNIGCWCWLTSCVCCECGREGAVLVTHDVWHLRPLQGGETTGLSNIRSAQKPVTRRPSNHKLLNVHTNTRD